MEYSLEYCKKCMNKGFDLKKGLICNISNDKPKYNGICEFFENNPDIEYKTPSGTYKLTAGLAAGGTRFANYIIDRIIIFGLSFLAGIVIALANGMYEISNLEAYAVSFILVTVYYTLLEATTGQSIGKMITGTIVVTKEGEKPDFMNILGRSLCRLIPFDAFSFLGSEASGWHDSVSKTQVIHKSFFIKEEKERDSLLDSGL